MPRKHCGWSKTGDGFGGRDHLGAGVGSVGRGEDVHDFLAAIVERLEGILGERGLADQNNAHYIHLPIASTCGKLTKRTWQCTPAAGDSFTCKAAVDR